MASSSGWFDEPVGLPEQVHLPERAEEAEPKVRPDTSGLTREDLATLVAQAGISVKAQTREAGPDSTRVLNQSEREDLADNLAEFLPIVQQRASETNTRFRLDVGPEEEAEARELVAGWIRGVWLDSTKGGEAATFDQMVSAIYDEMVGLSVIAPLWRDDTITEILVDGWDDIYIERNGRLEPTDLSFRSPQHAADVARRLAEVVSDRALTLTNPLVTARLPKSRIAFAYGDVVSSGLSISLRKFRELLDVDSLISFGALTETMRDLLDDCVTARANIVISGGTGAGKTTIINALSNFIHDSERVITIEDSFELDLQNRFWVPLQAKTRASADDTVSITISDLLTQTLRMRPDRIVVGEVRDGKAAATLLEAANTGHDGTMTTVHTNSAFDAINGRLPLLLRRGSGATDDVAKSEIASAFDLVVHVTRRHGVRFVEEIAEVSAYDPTSGLVALRTLFKGDLDVNTLEVTHRRVGGIDPNGALARKFDEFGIDDTPWR